MEYSKQEVISISIDSLFQDVNKMFDCVFTITANHDDAIKESASIFIKVYQQSGSFLDAPLISFGSKTCFEFTDPYVIGISVNNEWKNDSKICVNESSLYKIEGVTSNHRIFYGEYDGKKWVKML